MQSKYEKEYYGEHSSFANHNFEFGAATKPLCTSFCEQIFYVIFDVIFDVQNQNCAKLGQLVDSMK